MTVDHHPARARPWRSETAAAEKGAVPSHRPGVVIGGGGAGIAAARALPGSPARVTVIDRRNYSLFQPLLYQVATAALAPADVAVPIRTLLRGFRFTGRLAWLLWGAVHIYFLIGFRKRLVVLVNWLWTWPVSARGAWLITGHEPSRSVPGSRCHALSAATASASGSPTATFQTNAGE